MIIPCPHCGDRDLREFHCRGSAELLGEATTGTGEAALWHARLHLRHNPEGWTRELWYHARGCGAWLLVARNTRSHVIGGVWDFAYAPTEWQADTGTPPRGAKEEGGE